MTEQRWHRLVMARTSARPTGLLALGLAAGLLAQAPGAHQASPSTYTPIDVARRGPQVGGRVPDFNLKDQTGKAWTLPSIMGPKGAMLVLFRSADW